MNRILYPPAFIPVLILASRVPPAVRKDTTLNKFPANK
jgi:hypothetical protein